MTAIVPFLRYFNPTLIVTLVGQVVTFANGQGIAMSFQIERSLEPTPDTCSLRIANLDPVRATAMGAAFAALGSVANVVGKVVVRGGYDVTAAGLFSGDLRRFVTARRDGPDVWTEIVADDGGDAFSGAVLPAAFRSTIATTPADLIAVAAAVMGVLIGPSVVQLLAASDASRQGPLTAVTIGKATDALDAAFRRLRARWWIRDGQIHAAALGLPHTDRPAVLVTRDTIVGDLAIGGSGQLSVLVMFDPNIVPGGQVAYSGALFRVERVLHSGGTHGGQLWTSAIEGRAL